MLPSELIDLLQKLDPKKPILCQVVSSEPNGGAWNMEFKLQSSEVVGPNFGFHLLTVSHPSIKCLPEICL